LSEAPARAFDLHAHYVAQGLIETLARDGPAQGGGFLPYQLRRWSRGFVVAPPGARAPSGKPPDS